MVPPSLYAYYSSILLKYNRFLHTAYHMYLYFIKIRHILVYMKHRTKTETEILDLALAAAAREAGLDIVVVEREKKLDRGERTIYIDALLLIDGAKYQAEIKRWTQHVPIGALIDQTAQLDNGILIADYINPNIAERLRHANVQFLDTVGNTFIKQPGLHIQIKGNRPTKDAAIAGPRKVARAFTTAGLKVTYALLQQPERAELPYRQIAKIAGVTLGTVSKAIEDLKEQGYLVQRRKKRVLIRRAELFQKWIERYPATLRNKIKLGTFQAPEANWWKETNLENLGGCWGGEIAAMHYTEYLKPQIATVYLPRDALNKLIATAHLRKANTKKDTAIVEVYEKYWFDDGEEELADPILTYADLMATHDARNLETARRLYDERIARHLGET